MRSTSLTAYQQIKAERLLPRMQFQVYKVLHKRGPMTGNELNHVIFHFSAHRRLSELKRLGVIEEAGIRRDRISGRNALVWRTVKKALPKNRRRK